VVHVLDHAAAAITAAMIDMARRLNLTVTAEGVETEAELLLLRELGCDEGQGFLYSVPISPDTPQFCSERAAAIPSADGTPRGACHPFVLTDRD
jgi:EAL domain-containing protein (putative c-di-GMP-specific phosphodiesterase class I)